MSDGEPTDSLGTSRQLVIVVRLVLEASGKFSGEILSPDHPKRYRFAGTRGLSDAVVRWLKDSQATSAGGVTDPSPEPD